MKKSFLLLALAAIVLAGCKNNQPQAPLPTYTFIIYGAAGIGDNNAIDYQQAQAFDSLAKYGADEQIQIVAQFNYQPAAQTADYPYIKGTQRMVYVKGKKATTDVDIENDLKSIKTKADSDVVYARGCNNIIRGLVDGGAVTLTPALPDGGLVKLYEPDNIAAFIDYAASVCPADYYIFSVTGHGGGWAPDDDCDKSRKASAWDDNASSLPISAKELVEGINRSKVASQIILIQQDACNMNTMENVSEYARTGVPYAMVAFHTTNGADNHVLANMLRVNADFQDAMSKYMLDVVTTDWTMFYLSQVSSIQTLIKQSVPLIANTYKNDTAALQSILVNLDYNTYTPYQRNLYGFYQVLAKNMPQTELGQLAQQITSAIADATYTCYAYETKYKNELHTAACCYPLSEIDYKTKQKGETVTNAIQTNAFYQATGWNTLFPLFTYPPKKK